MSSKKTDIPETQEKIDRSKRKITQGGLVVPAILTLANRPAWGADLCTPSGFESAQTGIASHTTYVVNPNWLTPDLWKSKNATTSPAWPSSYGKLTWNLNAATPKFGEVDISYWSGSSNKTKSQIGSVNPSVPLWLFSSLVPGYPDVNLTLYDALSQSWVKFIVASKFNETIAPLPFSVDEAIAAGPTSTWWNNFFASFYANCVTVS